MPFPHMGLKYVRSAQASYHPTPTASCYIQITGSQLLLASNQLTGYQIPIPDFSDLNHSNRKSNRQTISGQSSLMRSLRPGVFVGAWRLEEGVGMMIWRRYLEWSWIWSLVWPNSSMEDLCPVNSAKCCLGQERWEMQEVTSNAKVHGCVIKYIA